MAAESEKEELQRKIERTRDLLREYPDGAIHETIRDYIELLEDQLRQLES